ncbi:MAG: trigger factor [bacterium]|nr:trigger factor [bacterium]
MKITVTKLPHSEVKIEVVYTAEEFAPYWDRAKEKALVGVRVKGFRPGNAPEGLAEAGIDYDKVLGDATEETVRAALRTASDEEGLRFLGAPRVELKEHHNGISFMALAAVFPEIKLGRYKEIARAVLTEKRELSAGDTEVEDAVGWLLKSRKQEQLTDEFARTVGEFKGAADLKVSIREGILAEKTVHEADRKRAKMVEEIAKASKLDPPELMVERVAGGLADELRGTLESGGASFDEYVKAHYTDMAGLRAFLRPRAEANVLSNLVMHKIAEQEHLEPTPEEVQGEAARMTAQHKEKNFDAQRIFDYSYGKLQTEKVYRFLEEQK